MLTLKDVVGRDGVCWRFIGADAPDNRPTVNSYKEPACRGYPSDWDWWGLNEELGNFYEQNKHKRVELLEHISKRPLPTLLKVVHRNENDETLEQLMADRVEDMRGDVALCNYEMAQRTESLCRVPGGFVSTHEDYGLSVAQASFAREIWELKLRRRLAETAEEAATRERLRVVCDDVDELPNMTTVP